MKNRFSELKSRGWLSPVGEFFGFGVRTLEVDHTVIEFEATARHANPMGTLHGGIFCDISDYAMGMAWLTGLAEGETCTTIELKINFFRPLKSGKLIADARVLRRGRTIGYIECDLRDDAGKLLARAASTYMTLRGEQAAGR